MVIFLVIVIASEAKQSRRVIAFASGLLRRPFGLLAMTAMSCEGGEPSGRELARQGIVPPIGVA
jgi:hypothetical protein